VHASFRDGSIYAPHPHEVRVHADLDGFTVNGYDRADLLGVDILPLCERGYGLRVPFSLHPDEPGWADEIRPRLEAAIRQAIAVVDELRRHPDRVCGAARQPSADRGVDRKRCARPASHVGGIGQWARHASPGQVWD
jgi:hypothetical protein